MTRSELIGIVTEKVGGLTRRDTEKIVKAILDGIKDALARGEKVEIRGFGNFRLRERRSRRARNPKTGTTVEVPIKKVPFFKVGKEMKEMVDGKTPGL
ncbi:MAG: integration host factor subunit beta [Nitrospirae bacterium]|nr:integration host factor subunit beta [Nitrospirota bacterium]